MYWVWSLYSRENRCELVDRSEEMIQPRDEEVRDKCAVLVVNSLPCSAEDTGSILDLGRSHVLQSEYATATEPEDRNKRSRPDEMPARHNSSAASHSLQPEKARMQQQKPSAAENNQIHE